MPVLLTVKVRFGALKVAVTDLAVVIETVQVPIPEQAPDQPAKVWPEVGVAVSVTDVPKVNDVEQVEPQLIPDGLLVTVPVPDPTLLTDRV